MMTNSEITRAGPTTVGNFITLNGNAVFSNNIVNDYGSSGLAISILAGAVALNNQVNENGTANGVYTPTLAGAGFDVGCGANNAGSTGPGAANQMIVLMVYQPTPFQFQNGKLYYNGGTADATAESDACMYQLVGNTLTLIADSGLIAWSASAATPARKRDKQSNNATDCSHLRI